MKNDKYFIIKREYLALARKRWHTNDEVIAALDDLETIEVEDGVVIRRQDVFAAPAFFEYAGQIRTSVELMLMLGQTDEDALERLCEIADYFAEQAALAQAAANRKIPD